MTKKEQAIINDNLRAYLTHFEPIRIESGEHSGGFYVFQGNNESYTQYCYDIHYLNGWLYGAVQAKCGQIREKEGII